MPARLKAVATKDLSGHCHGTAGDYNRRLMPKITFLGAAGTVTGSKYLVEASGKRLLVDCGLFQGGNELTQRNWQRLPQDPYTIDFVVLTHAHLDHTGYLPKLVNDGYRGPIFANAATRTVRAAASRFGPLDGGGCGTRHSPRL